MFYEKIKKVKGWIFSSSLFMLILCPGFLNAGKDVLILEVLSVCFGALSIFYFFKVKTSFFHNRSIDLPILLFLGLFLVFGFFGIVFSKSLFVSLEAWFLYLMYFLVFIIGSKILLTRKIFKQYLFLCVLASLVLSVVGLMIYMTGSYNRLTSVFYWPNPFATYLLMMLPFIFYLLKCGELKQKYVVFISAPLIFAAFLLTGSRAAYITFIFLSLFLLFRDFKYVRKKYKVFILVFLLVFSVVFLTGKIKKNDDTFLSREINNNEILDVSSNMRLSYYDAGLTIVYDYLFFGVGLGTFSHLYPIYQESPITATKYIHNWYLEILLEMGVFVFLTFLLFFLFVFKKIASYFYSDGVVVLFLSISAYLMHNFVDIGSHYLANNVVFWFNLGLLVNVFSKFDSKRKVLVNKESIFFKYLFLFIGILIFIKGFIGLHSASNYNLGKKAQFYGDYIKANEYFEKSVLIYPYIEKVRDLGINYLILASLESDVLVRNFYYSRLQEITSFLVRHEGLNALNYELKGKFYESMNNFKKGEKAYTKAVNLNKFSPRHTINLASILILREEHKRAIELIDNFFIHYPEDVIERKRIKILPNQKITSGIKEQINLLRYLQKLSLNLLYQ